MRKDKHGRFISNLTDQQMEKVRQMVKEEKDAVYIITEIMRMGNYIDARKPREIYQEAYLTLMEATTS